MSWHGHWWTIAPRLWAEAMPRPRLDLRPYSTEVQDHDLGRITLTGFMADGHEDVLVILVHGLGGSAESTYCLKAVRQILDAGWSALSISLRGADLGGQDYYHAGLTEDVRAVLASREVGRFETVYVLGFSLGGHVALCLSAEDTAFERAPAAVAAVCPPLDLEGCRRRIDARGAFIYRRHLLRSLKAIYRAVARRRDVPVEWEEARHIATLLEWDERIVAPRFRFAGAADYYARVSVGPRLENVRWPCLIVASARDPMVPAATVKPFLGRRHPMIDVRWVDRGGHLGFPAGERVVPRVLEWFRMRPSSTSPVGRLRG